MKKDEEMVTEFCELNFGMNPEIMEMDDWEYQMALLEDGIIANLERKSFIFHPSYLSAYDALKHENPEWAMRYLEALMSYGIDRKPVPKEAREIPLVMAFLEGNIKTINKDYKSYENGLKKAKENSKKYFIEAHEKQEMFD